MTEEEKRKFEDGLKGMVDNLNKNVTKSDKKNTENNNLSKTNKNINRSNKLSHLSLFFAIIGGIFSTFSIIAIILGHIQLYKIKNHPTKYYGKGEAIAGLILGYIGLVLAILNGYMSAKVENELLEAGILDNIN